MRYEICTHKRDRQSIVTLNEPCTHRIIENGINCAIEEDNRFRQKNIPEIGDIHRLFLPPGSFYQSASHFVSLNELYITIAYK